MEFGGGARGWIYIYIELYTVNIEHREVRVCFETQKYNDRGAGSLFASNNVPVVVEHSSLYLGHTMVWKGHEVMSCAAFVSDRPKVPKRDGWFVVMHIFLRGERIIPPFIGR